MPEPHIDPPAQPSPHKRMRRLLAQRRRLRDAVRSTPPSAMHAALSAELRTLEHTLWLAGHQEPDQ